MNFCKAMHFCMGSIPSVPENRSTFTYLNWEIVVNNSKYALKWIFSYWMTWKKKICCDISFPCFGQFWMPWRRSELRLLWPQRRFLDTRRSRLRETCTNSNISNLTLESHLFCGSNDFLNVYIHSTWPRIIKLSLTFCTNFWTDQLKLFQFFIQSIQLCFEKRSNVCVEMHELRSFGAFFPWSRQMCERKNVIERNIQNTKKNCNNFVLFNTAISSFLC